MSAVPLAAPVTEAFNLVPDPTFESGVGAAQQSAGASVYTLSYDTGKFDSGAQSILMTRTAASPTVNIAVVDLTPTATTNLCSLHVTPGQVLSASYRVWCAVTGYRARVSFQWRDSSNAILSTDAGPLYLGLPLSQWNTIVQENEVAPANAEHVVIVGSVLGPTGFVTSGGEQAWLDSLIVNDGATVEPFFYGDQAGCEWTGTPDRSASRRIPQATWQLWDGAALSDLSLDGQYDGSTIQALSLATVETTS